MIPNDFNPTLSIAIPTFNRPEALERCLSMLIQQCAPHKVPIVVCDNHSPYSFIELLQRFQTQYPYIEYKQNSTNVGMGANFIEVVDLVKTKYTWLFSDDDLLVSGAIQSMLEACSQDHDIIIANRKYMKEDLSDDLGLCSENISSNLVLYGGNEIFLRASVRHFTFIGCLCFKTDLWKDQNPRQYAHIPYFPHLTIMGLISSRKNCQSLIMAAPLVLVRGGGFSWASKASPVWFKHLPESFLPIPLQNSIKRRALWSLWRDLGPYSLYLSIYHQNQWRDLKNMIQSKDVYSQINAPFLFTFNTLMHVLNLFVPFYVFNKIRSFYRFLKRI